MGLTICIVKNPVYVRDERRERDAMQWNPAQGDRVPDFFLDGKDFDALQNFLDIKLSSTERRDGESYAEHEERLKNMYLEAAGEKGFEMPGRIWDWYQDAAYFPSEINQLLAGCQKIKESAQNPDRSEAMDKLINACREALKTGSGIYLGSN
ncbi:MAG: hypothetical protein M3384_21465 [Acidobacteriota bacterium]|nr:hypothetical protein [Acidobacteriota bacterium]